VLDDLQPEEAAEQQAEGEQYRSGGKAKAKTEAIEVGFGIVEVTHGRRPA